MNELLAALEELDHVSALFNAAWTRVQRIRAGLAARELAASQAGVDRAHAENDALQHLANSPGK